MFYPQYCTIAISYMIVAFLFLVSGQAPLNYQRPPFTNYALLATFLPYFICKSVAAFLSYDRVNSKDIWVAQEIFFSYSFASTFGAMDAFYEKVTGKALGGWFTGEGKRRSKLEWLNALVVLLFVLAIFIEFIMFLVNPLQNIIEIAALFFSFIVVMQMWPMVSTTLYEFVHNSHLPAEEKVDLHRYEVPDYIIFTFVLVFGIIVSVFSIGKLIPTA